MTLVVNCLAAFVFKLHLPVKAVCVTALEELDRMDPEVALVTHQDALRAVTGNVKVVFKCFGVLHGMILMWYKVKCCSRLPLVRPYCNI